MLEYIKFDEHGIFVWSSYVFTFVVLSFLFIKTKNSLKSYEKKYFSEFSFSTQLKVKINREKRRTGRIISTTTSI